VTTDITTLREALAVQLATDLGIPFKAGKLGAPQEQGDIGCIYPVTEAPWSNDVNVQTFEFAVRVYKRKITTTSPAPEQVIDPTSLEDTAKAILQSLKPVQADQTSQVGYFQWVSTEYDHDEQGVEVRFRAWSALSEFAAGG
jgi:hypothetical protein